MPPKRERPVPGMPARNRADLVINRNADLIQNHSVDQAVRRLARRFNLSIATACAVAELAMIGGAP